MGLDVRGSEEDTLVRLRLDGVKRDLKTPAREKEHLVVLSINLRVFLDVLHVCEVQYVHVYKKLEHLARISSTKRASNFN